MNFIDLIEGARDCLKEGHVGFTVPKTYWQPMALVITDSIFVMAVSMYHLEKRQEHIFSSTL